MIDPEIELWLSVQANAFYQAIKSNDIHYTHTVIQNTHQSIQQFEEMAFNASVRALRENK